jgi:putative ABC transport system permease protein
MLKSYLLTLYRSVLKHRMSSALNILGLAVGLAVFLVLTLASQFEQSFDRWIPNAERTYRVNGIMKMPGRPQEEIGLVPGPTLPNIQAEFGQVEAGARVLTSTYAVKQGGRSDYEEILFADPSFFDVFDLPIAAGDAKAALSGTTGVVISETMARKYFGTTRALGQRLTIIADGVARDFRVGAVLKDLPENTHLKIGLVGRLDKSVLPHRAGYLDVWNATNYATYVRLGDASDAAAINAAFPSFLQRRSDVAEWFDLKLEPLADVHFNASPMGAWKPGADRRLVVMLQVVGVLTLLLAVINYVNLATARAGLRAKEVALRKVFGATRRALIAQFLVEAVAVALVAGIIALALVELSLPLVNTALGAPLDLKYLNEGGILPLFLALTVIVGLASGIYPSLVISRFQPAGVLAASRSPGGGRGAAVVREVLVVAQFAISTALLICTAVVFAQADFVRKVDLGFKREGLILVREAGADDVVGRIVTASDTMARIPGVVSTTIGARQPGDGGVGRSTSFVRAGLQGEPPSISWEAVGARYFETLGIPVVAGRKFNLANPVDDMGGLPEEALNARGLNVMINETASKALGFRRPSEAIGQVIRHEGGPPMTVVGVAKDARFGSLREKVPPLMYFRDTSPEGLGHGNPTIIVRYRGDPTAITPRLEQAWRQVIPEKPFKAETVDSALDAFYEPDERRSRLITLGAVVAGILGCLGLYGLAAFSSERRTKEIGVRKVLGASSRDIFRLLVRQFLRPVVLANLIAWPAAYLLMKAWLDSFDQRVPLSATYFIIATLLALGVALATVTGQAMRAARLDPGQALRQE